MQVLKVNIHKHNSNHLFMVKFNILDDLTKKRQQYDH